MPSFVTRDVLKRLPDAVKRVNLVTNGRFRGAQGWRELPGGTHVGGGQWILPLERVEADDE